MQSVAVLACLLAAAHAGIVAPAHLPAAPAPAPAHAVVYDHYAPPSYRFDYAVADSHTGDAKTQFEHRDGDRVTGAYSLIDADGTTRIVEYTADDHNGFQAVVKRIGHPTPAPPRAVVVAAPAPAPAAHAPVYAAPAPAPAPVAHAAVYAAPAPVYAAPAPAAHAAVLAAPAPAAHAYAYPAAGHGPAPYHGSVAVLACLLAATHAGIVSPAHLPAAPAPAPAHAVGYDHYALPSYKFDYAVADSHTGDAKTQFEHRDGDRVTGAYSLIDADGTTRIVEYTADDHNGFQAVVKRIGHPTPAPPRAVVVAAPAPAPAAHAPVYAAPAPAPAPVAHAAVYAAPAPVYAAPAPAPAAHAAVLAAPAPAAHAYAYPAVGHGPAPYHG
ncbi:cuticle protein-like [Schistocerca piceifrons]|uniref:cuticle protein-like n=1 Tax=Schistocerca piceifrons TaxID=274613 RepID=UPI001F5E6AE8|nr:cuticle protein-like [Schistocerca piceifrons]